MNELADVLKNYEIVPLTEWKQYSKVFFCIECSEELHKDIDSTGRTRMFYCLKRKCPNYGVSVGLGIRYKE